MTVISTITSRKCVSSNKTRTCSNGSHKRCVSSRSSKERTKKRVHVTEVYQRKLCIVVVLCEPLPHVLSASNHTYNAGHAWRRICEWEGSAVLDRAGKTRPVQRRRKCACRSPQHVRARRAGESAVTNEVHRPHHTPTHSPTYLHCATPNIIIVVGTSSPTPMESRLCV